MGSRAFELDHAQNAFFQLVGPYINAYAFGDVESLKSTLKRVLDESRTIGNLNSMYPGVAFNDRKQWNAVNKEIGDGLAGLISALEESSVSIRQQRDEHGITAAIAALEDRPFPAN